MVRKLSAHLKAVSVSLARVFLERDGDGITIAINDLRTCFGVKPCFVYAQRTRILAHIVVRRTVLVADTVLNDRIGSADTLEEIPSVIAVIPCTATDIVVSRSGELLIRKTVGIASEVGGRTGHRLVVEIVMAVHILDDVVATILHLATGVSRTVYIEVLKKVVTAFVMQVILAGIAQREVFDMQVRGGTLDLQAACSVRGRAEVEYRRIGTAARDTFVTGDDDALGRRAAQVLNGCIAQVILSAEQIERVAGIAQ